jgi:hypothetical protein
MFLCVFNLPKWRKICKPNDHKINQMAIKYSNEHELYIFIKYEHKYAHIFRSKALQKKLKL